MFPSIPLSVCFWFGFVLVFIIFFISFFFLNFGFFYLCCFFFILCVYFCFVLFLCCCCFFNGTKPSCTRGKVLLSILGILVDLINLLPTPGSAFYLIKEFGSDS